MEENRYRKLLEQERRDHELAVRLAQESNGQVEDSPLPVRRYRIVLPFYKKLNSWSFIYRYYTNWRKVETSYAR